MQAKKLILQTDSQGVLHGLPILEPNRQVEIILLMNDNEAPRMRRKPSPRLAYRGASVQGDDLVPAIGLDEWGSLYQDAPDTNQ